MKIGKLIIIRADGKPMTVRGQECRDIMRRGGFGRKEPKGGGKK